jgi:hypothetical protein
MPVISALWRLRKEDYSRPAWSKQSDPDLKKKKRWKKGR